VHTLDVSQRKIKSGHLLHLLRNQISFGYFSFQICTHPRKLVEKGTYQEEKIKKSTKL